MKKQAFEVIIKGLFWVDFLPKILCFLGDKLNKD